MKVSPLSKLWQKSSYTLADIIEKFTVGDDYRTDMALVIWDIIGNSAQAKMLYKIGLLTQNELFGIEKALAQITEKYLSGNFTIALEDEDVHTRIEKELTEMVGEAGKKIHTGRSRNDQVMLDMRLLCKDGLLTCLESLVSFALELNDFAKKYEYIPMPGYTHMQRGMPSSVGMWASSFVEEIIDNIRLFESIYEINDMSPLGSGAGYGVPIPVDREYTAEILGFSRVQSNSLYCQNSRGRIEMKITYWLMDTAGIMKRMASDLLLFTTQEYGLFKAGSKITTGSSIMPQKRNLDVMELIRGKHARFVGILNELVALTSSLPSGYNRDLQETKKLVINSFDLFIEFCGVMEYSLSEIEPVEEKLKAAMSPDIFAADEAFRLVTEEGIPFREAYKQVGDNLDALEKLDPSKTILNRKHTGSTGKLNLEIYRNSLENISDKFKEKREDFYFKIIELITGKK